MEHLNRYSDAYRLLCSASIYVERNCLEGRSVLSAARCDVLIAAKESGHRVLSRTMNDAWRKAVDKHGYAPDILACQEALREGFSPEEAPAQ